MARGGGRSSLFQPGRTAEQLDRDRHRVTRVHAFYSTGISIRQLAFTMEVRIPDP